MPRVERELGRWREVAAAIADAAAARDGAGGDRREGPERGGDRGLRDPGAARGPAPPRSGRWWRCRSRSTTSTRSGSALRRPVGDGLRLHGALTGASTGEDLDLGSSSPPTESALRALPSHGAVAAALERAVAPLRRRPGADPCGRARRPRRARGLGPRPARPAGLPLVGGRGRGQLFGRRARADRGRRRAADERRRSRARSTPPTSPRSAPSPSSSTTLSTATRTRAPAPTTTSPTTATARRRRPASTSSPTSPAPGSPACATATATPRSSPASPASTSAPPRPGPPTPARSAPACCAQPARRCGRSSPSCAAGAGGPEGAQRAQTARGCREHPRAMTFAHVDRNRPGTSGTVRAWYQGLASEKQGEPCPPNANQK